MRTKKNHSNGSAEKTVKAIRRATRRQYAADARNAPDIQRVAVRRIRIPRAESRCKVYVPVLAVQNQSRSYPTRPLPL